MPSDRFIFSGTEKNWFICFCRPYVLLYRKSYLVNERLRSTFSKTKYASRSSYMSHHFSPLQFLLQQYTSPIAAPLVVNFLDVIIVFTKSTLLTHKISVLLKNFNLMVVDVYTFCMNHSVSVNDDFREGEHTIVVLLKMKR